jgi:hypothetical protein
MSKLTIGQKAGRSLQFLLGVRNRRIAASLKQHGFGERDLANGWTLLSTLTTGRLNVTAPPAADPRLVVDLDGWENKWFPITAATLASNYPDVHAHVFRNLAQTSGSEVVITVSTFLERIEGLAKPKEEGGLGREGRAARELLVKRGLTAAVIAEARDIIEKIGTIEPEEEAARFVPSEEDEAAERKLWAWYLEWSRIARVAITDRRLLRQLGFLQSAAGNIEEPVEPETPAEPSTPAAGGDEREDAPVPVA